MIKKEFLERFLRFRSLPQKKRSDQTNRRRADGEVSRRTAVGVPARPSPVITTRRANAYRSESSINLTSHQVRKQSDKKSAKRGFSFPKIKKIGWRAVGVFLTFVFGACCLIFLEAPVFQVSNLQIEGNERIPVQDIEKALNLKFTSIIKIDPTQVRQLLLTNFSDISDAQASVGLPQTLVIKIKERQPIISWKNGDQEFWIDAGGNIFLPRGEGLATLTIQANTPPMLQKTYEDIKEPSEDDLDSAQSTAPQGEPSQKETPIFTRQVDQKLINTFLALNAHLPPETALTYDAAEGFGWEDNGGWKVNLGLNLEDMEQRLSIYQEIVSRLEADKQKPILISVAHIHAPYYRLE